MAPVDEGLFLVLDTDAADEADTDDSEAATDEDEAAADADDIEAMTESA